MADGKISQEDYLKLAPTKGKHAYLFLHCVSVQYNSFVKELCHIIINYVKTCIISVTVATPLDTSTRVMGRYFCLNLAK